ncbi:MAG TPA: branched-chain amino acid ABC transporter permease [Gaiellaceae bacterium]|jgi:branched-chain amino acid transport system permease protein|nr:branched-chain amino acid ABC transporter permease [Gaiellaceae bacterium]
MFPGLADYKPFLITGLALGGVYALSGVGIVVLYRATGVLNLAFGAIGAMGALLSWTLINHTSSPHWLAYLVCVAFGALVTFAYGVIFGPPLARRDPLVKAMGTVGLALILLGIMSYLWPPKARTMFLPSTSWQYHIGFAGLDVNWTQIIGLLFGVLVTVGVAAFLRYTRLGTAMRALADDREITSTLGVPVRRVEAVAWLGSGVLAGFSGLLLSDLVGLDAVGLTFLVISALAAALIAQLRSLTVTLIAGIIVGLCTALLTPILLWPNATFSVSTYRYGAPFALAIIALLVMTRGRRVVSISRTDR